MSIENQDPHAQPLPDGQFWDGEPPPPPPGPEETLRRQEKHIRLLIGGLLGSVLVIGILIGEVILLSKDITILTQGFRGLGARVALTVRVQQEQIQELQRFEDDTLDYMSDLDAQINEIHPQTYPQPYSATY